MIPSTQLEVGKHTVQQLLNKLNKLRTGRHSSYRISTCKSISYSPFFLKRGTAHDRPIFGKQLPSVVWPGHGSLQFCLSYRVTFPEQPPSLITSAVFVLSGKLKSLLLANKALWYCLYERCYACADGISWFFRQLFCLMLKFRKHIIKITKCWEFQDI